MAGNNMALVLGASGGIGGEVARQLQDCGWEVRALRRGLAKAEMEHDGLHWLRGDALQAGDVLRAARGCAVIVHAVNPAGYRQWDQLVLPMLDNTLAAAIAEQATVLLPSSVYNYGPDAFPLLHEDAPQQPLTRKGAIRVELERRLQAATAQGARALIVRAGDFFGPKPGNNWFSQALVRPGRPVTAIRQPGTPGIGHQWAYLPDVARTMCALLARRDELAPFSRFHMAGHWDADGSQMAAAICRVLARHGEPQPQLRALPWWLLRLAAPFATTPRELLEMRYLWQTPVRLDNARLLEILDQEPCTPLDEAVETTLMGLGCLQPGTTEPVVLPASDAFL
jgi:nucleoside-diphosphate-sugar epimerase